jgi:hypothetical protein
MLTLIHKTDEPIEAPATSAEEFHTLIDGNQWIVPQSDVETDS